MTRLTVMRGSLACAGLIALAPPAWAQDPVESRLAALETQLRAQQDQIRSQQVLIEQQARALQALQAQATVPDTLPGQPVLPTEMFLAPPAEMDQDSGSDGSVMTSPRIVQAPDAGPDAAPVVTADGSDVPPSTGTDTLGTSVRRALDAARALATADADRPRVLIVGGRPTIMSADGRYSLSLRGIAQLDAGFYSQAPQRPAAQDFRRGSVGAGGRETNAAADLSNGANFRRARLGVEGVFDQNFNYRLMLELGGSGTEGPARINDAWIAYTGFAPFVIQAGAFSPPANMDDGQSPEDQLFLERASSAELSRTLAGADGRVGIGVRASDRRWFGALTLTGPTVNDAETFDEQLGLVGRGGILVLTDQDQLQNTYNVQIGVNGSTVFNTPDQGLTASPRYPFRFRDRPELRLDGTRLIDTGPIDASHASTYGVEFGAQYRGLYLQGEYFWYSIDRRDPALADPNFRGGYIEGSWILTGEFRRYNIATGSFQNPRPYRAFAPGNGGWGAVELAARYSYLDLDYREGLAGTAAAPDAVRGGTQRIVTIALNWYLNSNVKLLFNFQHADVDRLNPAGPGNPAPFGTGTATPPIGAQIGQSYDAVSIRSQFAF